MRKAFVDANVLVSVLNKEYPLFRTSARVLSLASQPGFELFTSPTCLAIAFYFAEKKSGTKEALQKFRTMQQHIKVVSTGQEEVTAALSNKKILDFEDGLQYYSAVNGGCEVIITEDQNDFHFAELPVLNCEQYLRQVALPFIKKEASRLGK